MCDLCSKYSKKGLTEAEQSQALKEIGQNLKLTLPLKAQEHLQLLIDKVLGVKTIEHQDFEEQQGPVRESGEDE